MSQGQTVKGKTTSGRNVEIQVDEDGRLVIAGVTLDPAGLATVTKQDEIIAAIEGITIPPPVGGATLAEQQAQTALLTTIEANQLPDSHNVTVDNLPADYPLPASQVTTLTPPAAITGFATETTLASRLSESDFDSKIGSLTETAPATDTASSGLNGRLQRLAQRLTSVIALLPGSLGQKARAASLAVTLSTEDVTALTPPAAITGFATQTTLAALLTELQLKADLSETQPVSIASVPSHAVTNAGTFAVQNTAATPAGNNNIGDVDVASLPVAFNTGTRSATTQRVTIATDDVVPVTGTFWQATQPVSLASVPSHAVTNVGTFAVQAAQSGTWNIGTLTSITNNVNTVEVAPTTIYNGNKNVTTAGTRVTLASSQAVKSVTIKAKIANTGTIYVGDGSVASSNGFALAAGETLSLDLANLNTVNLDASVSGEGVTYIGVN